jgi:hypothetical protein
MRPGNPFDTDQKRPIRLNIRAFQENLSLRTKGSGEAHNSLRLRHETEHGAKASGDVCTSVPRSCRPLAFRHRGVRA